MRFIVVPLALVTVLAYIATRRESMQKIKPKRDERMAPRWLVQNSYEKNGDES